MSIETGAVEPLSAPMAAVLESPWAAIRARHTELPAVMMIFSAGPGMGRV